MINPDESLTESLFSFHIARGTTRNSNPVNPRDPPMTATNLSPSIQLDDNAVLTPSIQAQNQTFIFPPLAYSRLHNEDIDDTEQNNNEVMIIVKENTSATKDKDYFDQNENYENQSFIVD